MYHNDRINHESVYNAALKEFQNDSDTDYRETSIESSEANDNSAAAYYQGVFHNGWSIYSALGYDRLRDNLRSAYSGLNVYSVNRHRNTKDYIRGELDLNYSFNDAMALNFGYRGIWNNYKTFNRDNNQPLSKYEDNRHNGYVFFDWSFANSLLLHIGTGVEAIHNSSFENKRDWLNFLPQTTVTWQPSENVQLMGEYTARMEYPSLYQVSASPAFIDQWLIQTGNPQLTPSRHQTVSLQATLFDALILGAEYVHSSNSITDWYEKSDGNRYLKTFTNARNREFRTVAAYEWTITKGLTWNNIIQWQWQEIAGHGLANHASNLSWNSNMEYWIKPIELLAKVEYSREMQKIPLLQGWQQFGQDLWQLSLRKTFINNSLSVSLNYVPPIHIGVRTAQKSCIETPSLNLSQNLNLRTYDNLLMLRIEWRFNKGRNKQRQVQQYEFDSEQKQDKGLL